MSLRRFIINPGALAAMVLLPVVCLTVPACFAGGAAAIVPDKHQLAPRGSYIPDHRVKAVLKKIEEHKALMEKQESLQQKEQPQENTSKP